EFGLVRLDGDEVGFLHDSFIDYFCGAVALRQYRRPARPRRLPDDWPERAAARLAAHPAGWTRAAQVPRGLLSGPELETLAERLLPAEPRARLPALLLGLLRGDDGPVARALRAAVVRHGPWAHAHPEFLFQECCDHLWWCEPSPGRCREFVRDRL